MRLFEHVRQDSLAYVILHAKYRRRRGRRPSATLGTHEANPEKALRLAEWALHSEGPQSLIIYQATWEVFDAIVGQLGLQFKKVHLVTSEDDEAPLDPQPHVVYVCKINSMLCASWWEGKEEE